MALGKLRTMEMPEACLWRTYPPVRLPPTAEVDETGWMSQVSSAGCQRGPGGTTA